MKFPSSVFSLKKLYSTEINEYRRGVKKENLYARKNIKRQNPLGEKGYIWLGKIKTFDPVTISINNFLSNEEPYL